MTLDVRCDLVAGQLLLCHGRDWAAERLVSQIREGEIDHVEHGGELADRLAELNVHTDLRVGFHLLHVPDGQELWKVNALQQEYRYNLLFEADHKPDPQPTTAPWDRTFLCAPNGVLSTAGPGEAAGGQADNVDVELSDEHLAYASAVGFDAARRTGPRAPRILVLDTGVAPTAANRVVRERNFVGGPQDVHRAADDNGHGSVICSIIADVAPEAELIVYKVAGADGFVSEWDTLCALAASAEAEVINMSLVFGLQDAQCPECGMESGSARSAIFEYFLAQIAARTLPPIVVAAAGNKGEPFLFYPARFGSVVAVGALTSDGRLSSFSNYGTGDHYGDPHQGGFKRSSQPLDERRLRWVRRCGGGRGLAGRSCDRPVGRRSGGLSIGVGSGKRSLAAPPARRLRRRPGCRAGRRPVVS